MNNYQISAKIKIKQKMHGRIKMMATYVVKSQIQVCVRRLIPARAKRTKKFMTVRRGF